jgi:N-acetylglucosaminyldiphosphoundecaprenol N-acetyl-beta-D-mannosaminyltransferase
MHRRLVEHGRTRFPNADFVLLYDAPPGPITREYVDFCVDRIEAAKADLVFVCLCVPRHYYWVAEAKARLGGTACLSVGGDFDLVTGMVPYAPHWMQRCGLTWVYRLVQEPKRMWRRYLKYNALFVWLLFWREVFTGKIFSERVS